MNGVKTPEHVAAKAAKAEAARRGLANAGASRDSRARLVTRLVEAGAAPGEGLEGLTIEGGDFVGLAAGDEIIVHHHRLVDSLRLCPRRGAAA